MYADYEYYKDIFLGGKEAQISASDFEYYENQAENKINMYTYDRLKKADEIPEAVKSCVCAIAERINIHEKDVKNNGIASEKVGDYSVSYVSQSVLKEQLKTDIQEIITEYLFSTGLLSRIPSGRCRHVY